MSKPWEKWLHYHGFKLIPYTVLPHLNIRYYMVLYGTICYYMVLYGSNCVLLYYLYHTVNPIKIPRHIHKITRNNSQIQSSICWTRSCTTMDIKIEWYICIYIYTYIYTGWWLGTCFIFLHIGNTHSNWLSYFSEGWLNHQPVYIHTYIHVYIHIIIYR